MASKSAGGGDKGYVRLAVGTSVLTEAVCFDWDIREDEKYISMRRYPSIDDVLNAATQKIYEKFTCGMDPVVRFKG
jgi:hypothetical protein